jgi:hypothetical protein
VAEIVQQNGLLVHLSLFAIAIVAIGDISATKPAADLPFLKISAILAAWWFNVF